MVAQTFEPNIVDISQAQNKKLDLQIYSESI